MMTWNHRVVKQKSTQQMIDMGYEEYWYGIHEVFYDNDTKIPHSCTKEAINVTGENIEEIKETLERMLKATMLPVLDYDLDFPEEAKDENLEKLISLDKEEIDNIEPTGC